VTTSSATTCANTSCASAAGSVIRNGFDRSIGFSIKRLEFEHSAEDCPRKWDVGDNESSAALTDVPVRPLIAIWVCERVVFVQNRTEDGEESKSKDEGENQFSVPWQAVANE
jgi:hypothetical protein